MLSFVQERLVFLAVPKTGSTAYHSALSARADLVITNPPELKHAPLYRYNRFFRPMFDKVCGVEMDVIAVVRDPVSWLGSWYRYRQREFMRNRPNSTHGITFDEFVLAYSKGTKPSFANVGSQAKFLEPRPNGTSVRHLFRYENLGRLDAFLEQRLDFKIELQRENVSPNLKIELSPQVERKFRQNCPEEFDLYESSH